MFHLGIRIQNTMFSSRTFRKQASLPYSLSLQVTVEAVIGGSVLLPCSSVKHDLELKDINVHWRHTNGKIVHDIVQGEDSVAEQDPEYKNRVKTFPEEYQRGNFSLKLNNLQDTDAGEFKCLITPSDEQKTVQMIIKGV
uniref:Ig-like domain-containing protein n=1 Tax=Cyprinus carpio carpio TaxID=630221 RepID=A0A9J8DML7_CYPCA